MMKKIRSRKKVKRKEKNRNQKSAEKIIRKISRKFRNKLPLKYNLFDGVILTDDECIKERIDEQSFEKMCVIGAGQHAKVYLVKKKEDQKFYAMKVLSKKRIVFGNEIENIKTERKLLSSFRNPFVVSLHYAFQSEDNLFLVMDFVAAGELYTHIRNNEKFSEERARLYAAEIYLALEYLHGNKVIYRDLKPENILVTWDGHLKLCDFGLSKILKFASQKTNTWCGTPDYIAPEAIVSESNGGNEGYSMAVDWWALGVLLYEMIVGITPFHDRNINKLYEKIMRKRVQYPKEMSHEAKDLIKKMLVREPEKRLGSKSCLDIKNHPFFDPIDWKKVEKLAIEPLFVPQLKKSEEEKDVSEITKYVDRVFLEMPMNGPVPNSVFGDQCHNGSREEDEDLDEKCFGSFDTEEVDENFEGFGFSKPGLGFETPFKSNQT